METNTTTAPDAEGIATPDNPDWADMTPAEITAHEFGWTDDQIRTYLLRHGNLATPVSRYGRCTVDCIEYVVRYVPIHEDATGEPITTDALDFIMSLVVNDDPEIAYDLGVAEGVLQ